MANVRQTKAFMRAEVEDAYQSIAAQFREFRDTARVFKRVTKEGTAAHDEQVEQLANGQLGRIVVAFKGIEKSLALLFAECDRIFYTVTPERRKALHAGGRPMKYLLNSVLDRYKAAPLEGRLTLVAFWTVASSLSAYFAEHRIVTAHWKPDITVVDQLLEESKTYEDELRKFKVAVMKYVSSAQFTGVITRERLGEKWNIGNEEHEGEDALAEAEAQLADGNDGGTGDISNKIEYDDEAAKLKATKKKLTRDGERALAELARREATEFINATPSKKRARATKAENGGGGGGDDDNDDDDDEDADGDDAVAPNASADDLPVPKRVSKRGGKNLRRRTRTQIALLKAQARGSRTQVAGDDDDDDDEQSDSVDDEGNAKQKNDDDGGVDEPSVSGDSEGVGDFHPDESDDDSDDANDASQDSDDEDDDEDDDDEDADGDDDDIQDDDDDDEDDNNRDDDEDESEKKPARKPLAKRAKLANGTSKHKAHTTNGTASTTTTTTNGHAHIARKVIDLDEDRDDGEDTASEPAPVVVAQTHTASTSTTTTTTAPTTFVDPFADLEF